MLTEFHSSPTDGHLGYLKTLKRLKRNVYWRGLKGEVKNFIQQCEICQRQKVEQLSPVGLLQALPVPERPWEDVSMDFIDGLPSSKGYTVILVVVDRLTKYAHFTPMKHPYTSISVAQQFLNTVVKLHGFPKSIVSDQDAMFTSKFWQELFKLQGSQFKVYSAYHPQTDGQTEVVNWMIETYLRCFCSEQPNTWSQCLAWGEFWYNTLFHSSTRCTPFEAIYGILPPTLSTYSPGTTQVQAVDAQLRDHDRQDNLPAETAIDKSYRTHV